MNAKKTWKVNRNRFVILVRAGQGHADCLQKKTAYLGDKVTFSDQSSLWEVSFVSDLPKDFLPPTGSLT